MNSEAGVYWAPFRDILKFVDSALKIPAPEIYEAQCVRERCVARNLPDSRLSQIQRCVQTTSGFRQKESQIAHYPGIATIECQTLAVTRDGIASPSCVGQRFSEECVNGRDLRSQSLRALEFADCPGQISVHLVGPPQLQGDRRRFRLRACQLLVLGDSQRVHAGLRRYPRQ